MSYLPRIVDDELQRRLGFMGAVVIEGPKACGKTATARRAAASEALLDTDAELAEVANLDPAIVLRGATPRLIDEWQTKPIIWNYVRRAVDDRGEPGQFILTGSAVPPDDATRHSGAGRFTRIRMRTMSLAETGHSLKTVSLAGLFQGTPASSEDTGLDIEEVTRLISVGGWPALLNFSLSDALDAVRSYLDEVRRIDIQRVGATTHRDPNKLAAVMRSLARNSATYAASATIAADAGGADGPLNHITVKDYLDALDRLMVVEDQPAWMPSLRSRSTLRSGSKRHFVDPSLAVAALETNPAALLREPAALGFLFESLVVRDLRIYSQPLRGQVLQYRDSTGLEVDAIVSLGDGRWGAFEVKLGYAYIEQAAANLRKFADRVDQAKVGPPAVLGVITGTGYGYRRPNGVDVIPIGALGP